MTGTPDFPNDRVGTYTPGFASAQNSVDNGKGIYTIDETHGGPSSGPIIGSVTGNMSGQLLSYFKMTWSGPDPAPPYPDHVDFLVSTYLYAKAEVVPPPSATYPGSLSVTATASDGMFNETASASAGDAASSGGVPEVDGHHLVRAAVDAGTGIAEVYVDGTAQWSLTDTVPYQVRDPSVALGDRGDYIYIGPATADGGSFVQASARQDERDITISANIDVTNMKQILLNAPGVASVDTNGDTNYYPSPNVRSADGTMRGDTIYSYAGHHDGAQDAFNINWIAFMPAFVGNWHDKEGTTHNGDSVTVPDVVDPDTWKWLPSESQDSWDYGLCSMTLAPNYAIVNGYPKGQDAPAIYKVSYTATDNTDQVTAAANYVMTLHDPYEKNYPDHIQDITDNANEKQLGAYGSQAPYDGSVISATVTTENPWTVKVKASGEIPLPWIGGVIGVDVEKSVTDDDKVGVSCSDNHTRAGDYSYLEAVDHYIYHNGKVDTWGENGYTGTEPYEVWQVATPAHFVRLHTPYGNATAGPSPGH